MICVSILNSLDLKDLNINLPLSRHHGAHKSLLAKNPQLFMIKIYYTDKLFIIKNKLIPGYWIDGLKLGPVRIDVVYH